MIKNFQILFGALAILSADVIAATSKNDEATTNQTAIEEASAEGPGAIVPAAIKDDAAFNAAEADNAPKTDASVNAAPPKKDDIATKPAEADNAPKTDASVNAAPPKKDDIATKPAEADNAPKTDASVNAAPPKKDDTATKPADAGETSKKDTIKKQADLDVSHVDADLEKAVEEALKAIKKESPQVNEDSLRVWKNFKSTSKPVNFTYRFWGRRLILWLKEEKKISFHSDKQVGDVFAILYRKGLISKNAVLVLTVDAWSHLVYLEGAPSWENRLENRTPEGGTSPNGSGKQNSNDRSA